jgi:ketol-acid reductoisomerase
VKLIVDLIYEGGISDMRYSVPNTARFSDQRAGRASPRKGRMKRISRRSVRPLRRVAANASGKPVFTALGKLGESTRRRSAGARQCRGCARTGSSTAGTEEQR